MSTGLAVALSGQIALERRLDTIANNIANMNTAGFRADEVKFETVLANAGDARVAYASSGETFISRRVGPISQTGNPLDVAIDGDGWLGLAGKSGTIYTRDGRMHLSDTGELQSVNGYAVLDPGGGPIVVDSSAGEVAISDDGTLSQGGKPVGAIGLFLIAADSKLTRADNSGVIPSQPATPVEDLTGNGVRQGYVEGANVNPVLEMTKLIEVSRAFDSAAAAVNQSETAMQEAIRALGPS